MLWPPSRCRRSIVELPLLEALHSVVDAPAPIHLFPPPGGALYVDLLGEFVVARRRCRILSLPNLSTLPSNIPPRRPQKSMLFAAGDTYDAVLSLLLLLRRLLRGNYTSDRLHARIRGDLFSRKQAPRLQVIVGSVARPLLLEDPGKRGRRRGRRAGSTVLPLYPRCYPCGWRHVPERSGGVVHPNRRPTASSRASSPHPCAPFPSS